MGGLNVFRSTVGVGNAALPVMPSRMASRRFSRSGSVNLSKLRRGLIFFTCSFVFALICFLQIESCFVLPAAGTYCVERWAAGLFQPSPGSYVGSLRASGFSQTLQFLVNRFRRNLVCFPHISERQDAHGKTNDISRHYEESL